MNISTATTKCYNTYGTKPEHSGQEKRMRRTLGGYRKLKVEMDKKILMRKDKDRTAKPIMSLELKGR